MVGTDETVAVNPGVLFTDGVQKAIVVSGTDDGLAFESVALRANGRIIIDTLPSAGNDKVTVNGCRWLFAPPSVGVAANAGAGAAALHPRYGPALNNPRWLPPVPACAAA